MSTQSLLLKLLLYSFTFLFLSQVYAQDTRPPAAAADSLLDVNPPAEEPVTNTQPTQPQANEALQSAQESLALKDKMLADTERRLAETEELLLRAEEELRHQGQFGNHYRRRNNDIKTLAGRQHHSGGFGSLVFKSSGFRDESFVSVGARGGWIINRSVAIGLEAHGLIPTLKFDDISTTNEVILLGGYGGMFIEPILFSNQVVHVTFPIGGGAGWLGYHDDWQDDINDGNDALVDDDVFWYVEPGVAVEVNVSRRFRLNGGLSRRFTQDLSLLNTANSAFDSMSYFFGFKWGSF